MELALGLATLLMVLGMILACVGLIWAMIDGRLWDNYGETLMGYGLIVIFASLVVMMVVFFGAIAQCTFTTTCQL